MMAVLNVSMNQLSRDLVIQSASATSCTSPRVVVLFVVLCLLKENSVELGIKYGDLKRED